MQVMRETHRIRLWCDWLLLAAGFVALCIPLDLVADAAYRGDHTVLYWWLIAYSYPDGTPFATVVGLFVLVLTLLAYWISLRLLARAGWGVSREREPGTPRRLSTLLPPLALIVVATLLAVTIAPAALFTGKQSIDYGHLASADFQAHRYYLAREQSPSDGFRVLLYSCDALGVWCHEVIASIPRAMGQLEADGCATTPPHRRLRPAKGTTPSSPILRAPCSRVPER